VLPEMRTLIGRFYLDFISLVALALTCKRALSDTQYARGMRMADPQRPEHMPRVPIAQFDHGLWLLYKERNVRHVGFMIDAAERHSRVRYCGTACTGRHDVVSGAVTYAVYIALAKRKETDAIWFVENLSDYVVRCVRHETWRTLLVSGTSAGMDTALTEMFLSVVKPDFSALPLLRYATNRNPACFALLRAYCAEHGYATRFEAKKMDHYDDPIKFV